MKPDLKEKISHFYYNLFSTRSLVSAWKVLGYSELETRGRFSSELEKLVKDDAQVKYDAEEYQPMELFLTKDQLQTFYDFEASKKAYKKVNELAIVFKSTIFENKENPTVQSNPVQQVNKFQLEKIKAELKALENKIDVLITNLETNEIVIQKEITELKKLKNEITLLMTQRSGEGN